MSEDAGTVVEIVYDLKGGTLPGEYTFALWQELVRALPWLETEEQAGLLQALSVLLATEPRIDDDRRHLAAYLQSKQTDTCG